MRPHKYILINKKAVPIDDPILWGDWIEEAHKNGEFRVASTDVDNYTVSTVFLGLDHNFAFKGRPILFETMVFKKGTYDEVDQCRYSTWKQAEKGHQKMVKIWRHRK